MPAKTGSRVSLGLLLLFWAILPLYSFQIPVINETSPIQTACNPQKMHFIEIHTCEFSLQQNTRPSVISSFLRNTLGGPLVVCGASDRNIYLNSQLLGIKSRMQYSRHLIQVSSTMLLLCFSCRARLTFVSEGDSHVQFVGKRPPEQQECCLFTDEFTSHAQHRLICF